MPRARSRKPPNEDTIVTAKSALVVGITGISGSNVADLLVADNWTVYGLARRPPRDKPGVKPVTADLLDPRQTRAALSDIAVSNVYFCTWARQDTEAENRRVNGAMLQNLLDGVTVASKVEHVALVTGLKHYLGPFESYGKVKPDTPFREDQPRLPYENFYYDQEDILYAEAARHGFAWSVHRPHTLIGWALGNAMNMGVTLAVYAALCKELARPFLFPGTPQQYEAVTDVTDARILAKQLVWASTTPAAFDQAFNITNGDVFRWRRLWAALAADLGVEVAPYPGHPTPLAEQMAGQEATWDRIVARYGLQPYKLDTLASWWHTDADLGRELETFTDMTKSRLFGFDALQVTERSFTDLFARLRAEKIIPPRA